MDRRELGWGSMDWIDLAQVRTSGGSCEHGKEPPGSINYWEILN
jgi:hypothetical protein